MTITHHLDEATLMSFAAGSLPEALAVVAAAHISMCARCRHETAMLEGVGAALMSELAPAPLVRGEPPAPPAPAAREERHPRREVGDTGLPWPVARLVPGGLATVRWRWLGPGVWDRPLAIAGAGKLRLLKVAPGRDVPEHGHGGAELTLVLEGAFSDEVGRYARGDVAELDETVAHHPVTDEGADCICVVANEKPPEFRGSLTRQWLRLRRL
jgi:putative transcriptional regulator